MHVLDTLLREAWAAGLGEALLNLARDHARLDVGEPLGAAVDDEQVFLAELSSIGRSWGLGRDTAVPTLRLLALLAYVRDLADGTWRDAITILAALRDEPPLDHELGELTITLHVTPAMTLEKALKTIEMALRSLWAEQVLPRRNEAAQAQNLSTSPRLLQNVQLRVRCYIAWSLAADVALPIDPVDKHEPKRLARARRKFRCLWGSPPSVDEIDLHVRTIRPVIAVIQGSGERQGEDGRPA